MTLPGYRSAGSHDRATAWKGLGVAVHTVSAPDVHLAMADSGDRQHWIVGQTADV
jgi:hypothetical protein